MKILLIAKTDNAKTKNLITGKIMKDEISNRRNLDSAENIEKNEGSRQEKMKKENAKKKVYLFLYE